MTQDIAKALGLDKSAEKTGVPLPGHLISSAHNFERWISGGLAPLVGLNLYLLGCTQIARLGGSSNYYASAASLVFAVAALSTVYARAKERTFADYFGVGIAGMQLGGVLLLPRLALVYAFAALAGLFIAVAKGRVHGRAFAWVACWQLYILEQGNVPYAALAATVLLVPAAILLMRRKFLGAGFVVVAIAIGQAGRDVVVGGQGPVLLAALCAIAFVLAMVYELSVPIREFSTFRLLIGQVPMVAALWLLVWSVLPRQFPARQTIWIVAAATAALQLVRLYQERLSVPTRIAWVGAAAAAAVTAETELVSAFAITCQLVAIAGALHMAAIVLRARALADTGVLLLAGVAAVTLGATEARDFRLLLVTCLVGSALVLASAKFPTGDPLPWWSGFIRENHANLIRDGALKVGRALSELAFVKILFGWVGLGFVWFRFCLDATKEVELRPLVNLSGHAFLGLLACPRAAGWLRASLVPDSVLLESVLSVCLCNAYGVLLVARGLSQKRRFTRLVGFALVLAPVGLRAIQARTFFADEVAWMLLTTGVTLAMCGLLVKRAIDGEPEEAKLSPCAACVTSNQSG